MGAGVGQHDAARRQHAPDGLGELAGMDAAGTPQDSCALVVAAVDRAGGRGPTFCSSASISAASAGLASETSA